MLRRSLMRFACVASAVLAVTVFVVPCVVASDLAVHYHRPDADYEGWTLWTWNPETGKSIEIQPGQPDAFGLIFRIETDDYGGPARLGILPKYRNWESKDDPDRFWYPTLGYDVYLLSADKNLFASRPDVSPRVVKALLDSKDRVRLVLSKGASSDLLTSDQVVVRDGQGREYAAHSDSAGEWVGNKVKIIEAVLAEPIPLDAISGGTATFATYKAGPLVPGKIMDAAEFSTQLELGAVYSEQQTTFRAFAPTALSVAVRLYSTPDGGSADEHPMKRIGGGVWEISVEGNIANRYYTYFAKHADGEFEVIDPYSKCNTAHNGRGMIVVDRTPVAPSPVFDPKDAILYEMHIRDFTIDTASGIAALFRGKYLGLTEEGTTLADDTEIRTGIDHLKELGVNVVQIMPFFDFDNIEAAEEYNWGYMPFHFFAPDGWFSTRRQDATRVKEVKQMIDAFHRNGMKVVVDVVYNHTAEGNPNICVSFNGLAPNYYYRQKDDGSYWNGSGCGNEFRSESQIGRKYILDSVKYWVSEYGVDGFRFDLMGLIDLETLKQVVAEVRRIKPDALIYGEPWAGGNTPIDKTEKGDQRGLGFAVFNDHFRDAIKGSTFSNDPGFVQSGRDIAKIKLGIKGSIDDFAKEPGESINYVEAHDNHTLWDRLVNTTRGRPTSSEELVKMHKLAAALVLTSQGIPFIHSGQEMLRTKEGLDNTYNKPDRINQIHWRWKKENKPVFEYYRGLIQMRRRHPMFRMAAAEQVKKNIFFLDDDLGLRVPPNAVAYVLHKGESGDEWANALLLFNANSGDVEFTVPRSVWHPAGDSIDAAGRSVGQPVASERIRIPAWTAGIFFNTDEEFFDTHLNPVLVNRQPRAQKFSVRAPGASKVALAGSFNSWKTDQYYLEKQPDGSWTVEIDLSAGEYEYKFLADGDWDKLNKDNQRIKVK